MIKKRQYNLRITNETKNKKATLIAGFDFVLHSKSIDKIIEKVEWVVLSEHQNVHSTKAFFYSGKKIVEITCLTWFKKYRI